MSGLQHAALLLVDLQIDFLPGGALAVTDGDAILEPIRELAARGVFPLVVATQDWHPRGHVSFASSHPGRKPFDTISLHGEPQVLWPDGLARDYCVSWTALDATDLGFTTTVLWDLTRPVSAAHDAHTERRLRAHGVSIVQSATLFSAAAQSA